MSLLKNALFGTLSILAGCSSLQMKQNLFSPENQLFVDGKFSLIEEKQTFAIQESGWGKMFEHLLQAITFPIAMIQSGNSLEAKYDESLLKMAQSQKKDPEIPVKQLLKSPEGEVRSLGIELTSKVNILLKYLQDPDSFVRIQALEKLRETRATEVVIAIEQLVREDPEEFVQIEGIRSLGELHFPESLNILAGCLRSPKDHIRREAVWALRFYSPKQSIPLLLTMFQDPIFFIRDLTKKVLEEILKKHYPSDPWPEYEPSAIKDQREQQLLLFKNYWEAQKNRE
ncbi:MAG: HEAT repeat domain-containing protein [Planctomycetota bacterium]|mgnify:CR=1 FL=1